MTHYIDGFVFSIRLVHLGLYQQVASGIASIYKEYGAIDYQEFIGDDLEREGTLPFPSLLETTDKEAVIFGWIVYPSKDERDRVSACIESDIRVAKLVSQLIDPLDPVFNAGQMAFGGFRPFVTSDIT